MISDYSAPFFAIVLYVAMVAFSVYSTVSFIAAIDTGIAKNKSAAEKALIRSAMLLGLACASYFGGKAIGY